MKPTCLTFNALVKKLAKVKSAIILMHRSPDPDTIGSAAALRIILEKNGAAPVDISCADAVADKLSFLTDKAPVAFTDEYEKIITVDVASPPQLGAYSYLADRVYISIDHHESHEHFARYCYDDYRASCSEIIYDIAKEFSCNTEVALLRAIYGGMCGDTGCFKYSSTTAQTHMTAAEILSQNKIDHADIARVIFDCHTVSELRGQTVAYKNMKFYEDGKIAGIVFTTVLKEQYGISDVDISNIVDYVRAIEGVLVAFSLKEVEDGKYSLSTRANCDIDVSSACRLLGGGGHPRAAGATVFAKDEFEAEEKVLHALEAVLPWKK